MLLRDKSSRDFARIFADARNHLDRFLEELHVLGASTLSNRTLIERFKERSIWYDKHRLREVAERDRRSREDNLTLELAKYLHDAGLVVLVRPRLSNLEPDAIGLAGLAVESKAYDRSARRDIVKGYYQLHAYMMALQTTAMPVREGFLVAFRLGGALYDTPETMEIGRFLIHSTTIDLGLSNDSGRAQPQPRLISEEEVLRAVNEASEDAAAASVEEDDD